MQPEKSSKESKKEEKCNKKARKTRSAKNRNKNKWVSYYNTNGFKSSQFKRQRSSGRTKIKQKKLDLGYLKKIHLKFKT